MYLVSGESSTAHPVDGLTKPFLAVCICSVSLQCRYQQCRQHFNTTIQSEFSTSTTCLSTTKNENKKKGETWEIRQCGCGGQGRNKELSVSICS